MLSRKRVRFALLPSNDTSTESTHMAKASTGCLLHLPRKRQKLQSTADDSIYAGQGPHIKLMAERAATWYTKEEHTQMRQSLSLRAQMTHLERDSILFGPFYSELYEKCLEKTTDNIEMLADLLSRGSKPISWLVHHYDKWRGVEHRLNLPTNVQRRLDRRFAIRMILAVSNQNADAIHSTKPAAGTTVSRVSEILSHSARRLARSLAVVDACAALQEYAAGSEISCLDCHAKYIAQSQIDEFGDGDHSSSLKKSTCTGKRKSCK
jgi:hypothetical protein